MRKFRIVKVGFRDYAYACHRQEDQDEEDEDEAEQEAVEDPSRTFWAAMKPGVNGQRWNDIATALYIPASILASSEKLREITINMSAVASNHMDDSESLESLLCKFDRDVRIEIIHDTSSTAMLFPRNARIPCWEWMQLKEKIDRLIKTSRPPRLVMSQHVMQSLERTIPVGLHGFDDITIKDKAFVVAMCKMARFVTLEEHRRVKGCRGCFEEVPQWARPA